MATDNGGNVNTNSKWKFLSGEREYDLKEDQSLGSFGNKKRKWGRKEEGKVSREHLKSSKLQKSLGNIDKILFVVTALKYDFVSS